MGKGRTIASIVALALLIGLLGACGGGSSKSSSASAAARAVAQTKAARAKVLAAQRRLAAAQRRVTQQRLAFGAAVRRKRLQEARQETSTTTTTAPKAAPPPPKPATPAPTTPTTPATPPATVSLDAAAIQRSIDAVNAAFAKGVVSGIAASETANYYIGVGVYTGGQCSAFEAARGLGVVADRLVVHPGSVVPAPHWVDPVLGAVPGGRVYVLTMDDVQTQVFTKEQRTQTVTTHATVLPNGRALLFLRCR
jgi:hypothetical protein